MLKCLKSCCWDDVFRQRIPDTSRSHRNGSGSAVNSRHSLEGSCGWSEELVSLGTSASRASSLRYDGALPWRTSNVCTAILYRYALVEADCRASEMKDHPCRRVQRLIAWSRYVKFAGIATSTPLPSAGNECTKATLPTTGTWPRAPTDEFDAIDRGRRAAGNRPLNACPRGKTWKTTASVDTKVMDARCRSDGNAVNFLFILGRAVD